MELKKKPIWTRVVWGCTHAVVASLWCFLVVFGSVKEALQLQDGSLDMVCINERCSSLGLEVAVHTSNTEPRPFLFMDGNYGRYSMYKQSGVPFPYPHAHSVMDLDAEDAQEVGTVRCCTSEEYQIAYNIMNTVGGVIGCLQTSYFFALLAYKTLSKHTSCMFLLKTPLKTLIVVVCSLVSGYVYQHAVYNRMFCGFNQMFCEHPAQHYEFVLKVFNSLLAFGVLFFVLQTAYVGMFMWTFITRRMNTWSTIRSIENSILINHTLESEFDARMTLNHTYNLKNFVMYWMNKSDEEIIHELPAKAHSVLWVLREVMVVMMQQYHEGYHDTNADTHVISREQFNAYVSRCSVLNPDKLWSTLTFDYMYECISFISIEDVLYDLFFSRKLLASMIHTDLKLLTSMMIYLSMVLYPACCIVTARIFEYEDAFNRGVDLFKTYTLIVSFLSSTIVDNLQFLWLMLSERPFKIGDVLRLEDGSIYNVTDFNTTHTFLKGGTAVTISNKSLLNGPVVNLTKDMIKDSFEVTVPLNALFDTEDMWRTMRDYMRDNPRDIKESTVRCGWVQINDRGKTLRCDWKYKFKIMDRSRLLITRIHISDCFVSACNCEVIRAFLAFNFASGGEVRDSVACDNIRTHIRRAWDHEKNE